ncbi:hypothetical protein [Winogradskyella eckloniae]|uniref:hypothetical protein n=1 Tax=Winogradskyella eckloniae TaxID=1089306 RepID=UPI00293C0C59|nr:hypothetical protein [Winogradskyella eckloniae]
MLITIGVILLLIILFVVYRWIAFRRKRRQTDLLRFNRIKPLYDKLINGLEVNRAEVLNLAKDNKTRELTYQILEEHHKLDLFPEAYFTIISAAESHLVNWLEFPTELDKIPDEIEHLEEVTIDFDGNNVLYHVFKYKTYEPHWAADNGWMLGVVGPYFKDSKPYDFANATFSRCSSKLGEVTPKDEAEWVHKNIALRRPKQ